MVMGPEHYGSDSPATSVLSISISLIDILTASLHLNNKSGEPKSHKHLKPNKSKFAKTLTSTIDSKTRHPPVSEQVYAKI